MRTLGKISIIQFMLIICAIAQIVISMPHHHHQEKDVPCYNFIHCEEAHHSGDCSDNGSCCGEDDHNHEQRDYCSYLQNDFSSSFKDLDESLHHLDYGHTTQISLAINVDLLRVCYKEYLSKIEHRSNIGVRPYCTEYISKALPCRAPSA